ncbi:MAG: ABC transporter substrate-binding protein, partial [Nitrososphaerales archaeon]
MKPSTMAAVMLVIGLIIGGAVGYGAFALSSTPKTTTQTISGCTQSSTNSTETCTLGVVFPLTSSLSAFGKSFVQGVQLAVSQLNANLSQSGSNVRFATVVADDAGTPAGALSAVTNLFTTDNVHVIIGPLTTAEVQGALAYAQTNKILLLPPASSGTALNLPVFGTPNSFLIRPGQPGDAFESNALSQTILQFGIKNAVFIYSSDTSEAGTYNLTSSLLRQSGVKTTGIEVQPLQSDYTSAVSQANTQAQTYLSSGGTVNNTAIVLNEHGTDAQEIFSEASTQSTLPTLRWFGIEALNDNAL